MLSIKEFFKKLMGRSHPAHLPDIPRPPDTTPLCELDTNGTYHESKMTTQHIAGFPITFGKDEIVQVDERGNAGEFSRTVSHILGSGKLVSGIEPKQVAGQIMPGVAGVCPHCQTEAIKAFQANLISHEEAQSRSLYDTSSAAQCEICGCYTCCRHCRPIPMPDGAVHQICVNCQKKIKRQLLKQGLINLLLSPFTETEILDDDES